MNGVQESSKADHCPVVSVFYNLGDVESWVVEGRSRGDRAALD